MRISDWSSDVCSSDLTQDQPERKLMELRQQIRNFVTTNFYVADPQSLEDGTSLLDQGIIDSTGVLEVILFVETAFGVTVEDAEKIGRASCRDRGCQYE